MQKCYSDLFPDKKVKPMVFGWVEKDVDVSANNCYIGDIIRSNPDARGLAVIKPEFDADRLLQEVEKNGLIGLKPYPNFASEKISPQNVRITDMVINCIFYKNASILWVFKKVGGINK